MAHLPYSITATFTAASATVSAATGAFLANVLPGDWVRAPDEKQYFVTSVDSNTQVTLDRAYLGSTATAAVKFSKHSDGWGMVADANTRLARIEEALSRGYTLTSATSNLIGTGSKTFTVEVGLPILPGVTVVAASRSNITNKLIGQVASYSGSTLVVTVGSDGVFGSGTFADWNINLTGSPGPVGALGPSAWLAVTSWAASTAYAVGPPASVVTYIGETYVCTTAHTSTGSFDSSKFIKIAQIGNTGAPGSNGTNGSNGVDGTNAGFRFTFSTTTTMADPGNGLLRLNNAAAASATAIAIDDLSADPGNPDVSVSILAWDDSTNTGDRGTLILCKATAPQNFIAYTISGVTTDNAGWSQLAVTYVNGAGTLSNNDIIVVSFSRTGNKGADGAGTGDVTGPASSVDNSIALFNGTTGKLIKESAATVATVISTASADAVATIRNGVSAAFDTLSEIATDLGLKMVKTANLSDLASASTARTNLGVAKAQIEVVIDGGGVVITTGIKGSFRVPFNCALASHTLVLDQSGSIVLDLWKDTYANYPPTVADTITASAKPTISSATKATDSTLTGWTTTWTEGDIIFVNVDSITTAQRATISFSVTRS